MNLDALETELAGVLTLRELGGPVLQRLAQAGGASGGFVFLYGADPKLQPVAGSLAEVMLRYPRELCEHDPGVQYALGMPAGTFIANERGDFDVSRHLRSAAFSDFYRPNDLEFLQIVQPTDLPYGTKGMFGLAFATPGVPPGSDGILRELLVRLRPSLRAAARRIERFEKLVAERDALTAIVEGESDARVLWNGELDCVWVSPAAARLLDAAARRRLEAQAALAHARLRPRKSSPKLPILEHPVRLRSALGSELSVEFSFVHSARDEVFVLAQLGAAVTVASANALTAAERRVLSCLAKGLSNREIGRALFISEETVKTHVSRILRKLDVKSRARAAALAREMAIGEDLT